MCGLFGIAGPGITQQDLDIVKDLGIISQVRGTDGSGIFQVRSNAYSPKYDQSLIYKTEDTFSELLIDVDWDKKKYNNLLSSINVDVIIGHVRMATKGIISDSNAHPFVFENLVGAHNGTLKDKKYEDKVKTDSELMFADISANGLIKTLDNLHKDSAFAITMFDRVNRKMYFTRNAKRTLHFALNENRSVLYWASEPYFLKTAIKRRNVDAYYFSLSEDAIWELKPSDITSATTFKNTKKPFFKVIHSLKKEDTKKEEKHSEAPFDGGVKKENTKSETKLIENKSSELSSGTVLKFPINNFRSFYSKCVCGAKTFNLLQKDLCEKGKLVGYSFDPTNRSYYCDNCVKETQHAVH